MTSSYSVATCYEPRLLAKTSYSTHLQVKPSNTIDIQQQHVCAWCSKKSGLENNIEQQLFHVFLPFRFLQKWANHLGEETLHKNQKHYLPTLFGQDPSQNQPEKSFVPTLLGSALMSVFCDEIHGGFKRAFNASGSPSWSFGLPMGAPSQDVFCF